MRLIRVKGKPFEVGQRYDPGQRKTYGWTITGEFYELEEATRPVGIRIIKGTGGVTPTDGRRFRFGKKEVAA